MSTTRQPRLGSGRRFQQLKDKLTREGAKKPGGLAAYIGREKYGKKRFQELSAAGKRRAKK